MQNIGTFSCITVIQPRRPRKKCRHCDEFKAKSAIDSTADKAKDAADWLGDKAEAAKNTAVNVANTVEERAACAAKSVTGKLSDATEPMQKIMQENFEQGKRAIGRFGEDASVLIRNHPLTAVAAGVALGMLLSHVAARRT